MKASLRRALLRAVARVPSPLLSQTQFSPRDKGPRILIIRPDHIGDVLFTTPAIRALRSAIPDAHIAYMVGPWARDVIRDNVHLDEVIACPFPGFTRGPKRHLLEPYVVLYNYARSLRAKSFDMALILRFDHWWGAMLAYWAGVPQRVGYAVPEMNPFLTKAVLYVTGRHEVEQNMDLVATATDEDIADAGLLEFKPRPEDVGSALAYLGGNGPNRKYLCLHPGAGAQVKLWRPEAFAQVADTIAQRHGLRVIISGSSGERSLARAIAGRMNSKPLITVGQTSLGELAAIMGHCELVIGVDSGPMHLAVSQGVPTVHLYGPVDHNAFGPWGDSSKHLVVLSDRDCVPCNRLDYAPQELDDHPCVRSITVAQVLRAADSLLRPDGRTRQGMI